MFHFNWCIYNLFRAFPEGVVHRDIKMANIMLAENSDGSYTAKIADFGLAIQNETHSCYRDIFGNLPYFLQPPEELFQCIDRRHFRFIYKNEHFQAVLILDHLALTMFQFGILDFAFGCCFKPSQITFTIIT